MKKVLLFFLFLALATSNTFAQYSKLFDFTGASSGSNPKGSLFSDGTFLYGMTEYGGIDDDGVIFKIKLDGTGYSKLHDFSGYNSLNINLSDGSNPLGSLISVGNFLYGMTSNGGEYNLGMLFKIKPDGTGFTKLYDFAGMENGNYPWGDGSHPYGNLITDGTFLYGMTSTGGSGTCQDGCGIIFKIKPDGTGYTKLLDFNNTNGEYPGGSLIYDGTSLYGMTNSGGVYDGGVIFKINTDGSWYFKLLDFVGVPNGYHPHGDLYTDGNFLYGMTIYGGPSNFGNIFKIKQDGSEYARLLDFKGRTDGAYPNGSLISDGTFLYGMTSEGGTSLGGNGSGTIFKIKPDSTGYSKLFDCDSINGKYPTGSFIADGNYMYGMTSAGGTNNMGTIFKISPAAMGIAENNIKTDFNVYPNPSDGHLFLTISSPFSVINTEERTLLVCNMFGEKILSQKITNNKLEIDLSKQPNGIYFLHLESIEGVLSKTLIIN